MPANWQTVRIFISSTFRDMHSERDWLVKRVFPALRERLEAYRVHLIDIDLRWGVTEEQAESGGALDVCLEQIDECRPFFLGLLGERYGWVPEGIPERVTSKFGWIQHTTQKSITELEILHGVLREPEMHPFSFFCFRDPRFLASVPEPLRADLKAEDEESEHKLTTLKQTIKDAGLPVPPLENYPCRYAGLKINWRLARMDLNEADRQALEKVAGDGFVDPQEYESLDEPLRAIVHKYGTVQLEGLETFGERVREWLWEAICDRLNLPDQPPTLTLAETDPLTEEQDYHERFMESRLRVYVGREELQQELVHFADGDDEVPCLVTGPSGSGKSAAMAKFATEYAEKHSDVLVIPHFIGASPASTNLRLMLRRFCQILKNECGFDEDVPQDVNELSTRFRDFVAKVPEVGPPLGGRRVVFVIDALNQLDESDNAQMLYWLPWQPPSNVKLIVSCIADPDREEPALKAFEARIHLPISVDPLTDAERRQIIRDVPSLSAKTLDDLQINLLLANPATTNPLFLLVALEELRGFGSYEHLNRRIEAFPREGDTITEIFTQVIERLEDEFDPTIARNVLTLLASARRGLSDRELLDVIEGTQLAVENSTTDLFPVLRQLRPYLQPRGELLDFYHRNLYKAVRTKYLPDDEARAAAHARLVDYFRSQDYFLESLDEQRARATRLPPTPRPANVRKVDELPYHVLEIAKLLGKDDPKAKEWDAVADLLTDWHFLEAKAEAQSSAEPTAETESSSP